MAQTKKPMSNGDDLVKQQVISRADLDEAERREKANGTPWYRQLLQMKKLNFDMVSDVLHREFHPKALRESHMTLGQSLLKLNAITPHQLDEALVEQRRNGKLLGAILLEDGLVSSKTIAIALSKQFGLGFADVHETPSELDALNCVPESMAKQKEFLPVKLEGDKLSVLISGPKPPDRLKSVGILLGKRITPIMSDIDDMTSEIEARYSGKSIAKGEVTIAESVPEIFPVAKPAAERVKPAAAPDTEPVKKHAGKKNEQPTPAAEKEDSAMQAQQQVELNRFEKIAVEAQGVPVVKLVSTVIEGAVNSGATDIHLDPQEPEMRVRYRIDGVLHDVMSIPRDIENAVVSRLKILSDIDITETRHPQDGHISMDIGDAEYDVRVATLPTFLGERVVLRLLDQSAVLAGIGDLGLEADDEKRLARVIEQPYGMILVTGPTGSGKTTTLYSCLNEKDVMTDSIVTLEDPVEYQLSGINQVQIETDIDLTFANVLRASLRQDIDVLLVGEIRDPETARIAIRASMTGHLVFSTLHTNDAPEAIATLRNMDIPSYLISSALTAIVAQRLVRCICPECRTSFAASKTLVKSLGLPDSTKRLYRGKGCESCHHTGTKGRTGIFEVLEITPPVRRMIAENDGPDNIAKAAKLKTMAERCRMKVKDGIVAPEEFLRVIRT